MQGVVYPEIRRDSARALVDLDFPGYAIGGLSVGEPAAVMYEMVEVVTPLLPASKPRYLMGVGMPANLLEAIARGVDMFDCVIPTRNGRNGTIFTTQGRLNIKNAQFADDHSPLDPGLDTYVSQTFTKAYVRHLHKSREILGMQIGALQNLAFYAWLMRTAREKIQADAFSSWKADILPRFARRNTQFQTESSPSGAEAGDAPSRGSWAEHGSKGPILCTASLLPLQRITRGVVTRTENPTLKVRRLGFSFVSTR